MQNRPNSNEKNYVRRPRNNPKYATKIVKFVGGGVKDSGLHGKEM